MIVLYGKKEIVQGCFIALNIEDQFSNKTFMLDEVDFELIKDEDKLLKSTDKVFVCEYEEPFVEAQQKLIKFGFQNHQISLINNINMKLAIVLYDLKYNVKDSRILSFLLSNFKDLQKLYSSYLVDKYYPF